MKMKRNRATENFSEVGWAPMEDAVVCMALARRGFDEPNVIPPVQGAPPFRGSILEVKIASAKQRGPNFV